MGVRKLPQGPGKKPLRGLGWGHLKCKYLDTIYWDEEGPESLNPQKEPALSEVLEGCKLIPAKALYLESEPLMGR